MARKIRLARWRGKARSKAERRRKIWTCPWLSLSQAKTIESPPAKQKARKKDQVAAFTRTMYVEERHSDLFFLIFALQAGTQWFCTSERINMETSTSSSD